MCGADHNSSQGDDVTDTQTILANKTSLLEEFFKRYDFRLPIDLTPSDSTLTMVARAHNRRSPEFIPLSRVTCAAETRDIQTDPIRIKGTNGDLLLGPSKTMSKKSSEFLKSSETFIFAVKILMRAYVLVSCADSRDNMWCPLQSALKHILAVEHQSRAASRVFPGLHPGITEAEMSVRREWHSVGQAEPTLSLAALIELVGQRHSIWPILSELRHVNPREPPRQKGKGKGSEQLF